MTRLTSPISRRTALWAGATVAGNMLAGCAKVSRLIQAVHPPTLTLPSPPLRGWSAAVLQAWKSSGLLFHLRFVPPSAGGESVDADWVNGEAVDSAAAAVIKGLNIDPSLLMPTAQHAFTGPKGGLFALPVAVGEYQLLVSIEKWANVIIEK